MSNSFSARLIITVISLAILTFMGIFSETSLAIVSPHLMEEFHVSAVETISTKLLFKFAVIIFITGTIMGAFASNFTMLLLGRLIMAVGTGCSLPLLTNIVLEETTPYQRGTLLGIVGLVVSFAPVSGPVLGGLIAEYLGWRWVFLFMLPILVVSFIMGSTSIRDIRKGEVYHLDVKSFLISSAGLVSFIMGLSYLSTKYGILLICISFVFLGIFILLQLKVKYPLMNIKILKYKMFTLGLITVCMPMASVLALSFLIPILAQMGLGKNALQASFIMLPGTLFSGMLAPVMGAKYSKFGVRRLLIPGFIIMCLSMFYLVFTETTYISSIIGYICFMTGAAFCQVPAQTNALNALPQQYNADGTAILSTLQQTAGAAGTALASVLLSYGAKKAYNSGIDNIYVYGINYGFMLCLVFVLVGLFAAFQLKTTLEKENV